MSDYTPSSKRLPISNLQAKSSSQFRGRAASSAGSRSYRSSLLDDSSFWKRMDRCQVLGNGETIGHTGCVNALSWSEGGSILLSGSDDRRLCLWKLDDSDFSANERSPHPLTLGDSIMTAHRANIFSAKFMPHANHPIIISVAGDSQVMVYDVERLGRIEGLSAQGAELNGKDRRMVRQMTQEWGSQRNQESKVQCVRRFGVRPESPTSGTDRSRLRRHPSGMHVTAVDMSADVADDLIVSFSAHSVALFSIHDSPENTSFRSLSTRSMSTNSDPRKEKRRRISTSSGTSVPTTASVPRISKSLLTALSGRQDEDEPLAGGNMQSSDLAEGANESNGDLPSSRYSANHFLRDDQDGTNDDGQQYPANTNSTGVSDDDMETDDDAEEFSDEEGPSDFDKGNGGSKLFDNVPVVYPRRLFKGARNVETVKDVTFLGPTSNKVCSGSDDGNWFVWDKVTGRLEGIWEGDDSVVNVVEQHPSLPICAVSGIDSTIKMFAPLSKQPTPSYQKLEDAEAIMKSNQSLATRGSRSSFLDQYIELLANRGYHALITQGDDQDPAADCRLQ